MNEIQKRKLKRDILILGLATSMIGSYGCKKENEVVPTIYQISSEYNNFDDNCKYCVTNGAAVKQYESDKIFLLFDKDTYEVTRYIFDYKNILFGLGTEAKLYSLESGELLVYCDGISHTYNEEYYNYIRENNYEVHMADIGDYVEGEEVKEWYSLEEIKNLEFKIAESLKIINKTKKLK